MTNAHVVAGVPHPSVDVDGTELAATTVLFDPERDVAVLYVPGFGSARSPSPPSGSAGHSAIVIGYPENGPFTAVAARIRDRINGAGRRHLLAEHGRSGDLRHPLDGFARATRADRCSPPTGQVYGVVFAAATDDSDTGYAFDGGRGRL